MSEAERKPSRRADGTFAKGVSGNSKGRPKKIRRIPHPDEIRDLKYDVAKFETTVTINGKRLKLNLLQSNLLTLALAGATGDKTAARIFLANIEKCTAQELAEMARLSKTLEGVTPAYMLETDPDKRARLKESWRRVMAEANGRRPSTTRGLGKTIRR